MGSQRWYVVGVYVPPKDVPAFHCIEQAFEEASKVMEVVLLGDLNAKLSQLPDAREDELAIIWHTAGWSAIHPTSC